jgi:hypothetical protein
LYVTYHISLIDDRAEIIKFIETSSLFEEKPFKTKKWNAKGRSPKRNAIRGGAPESLEAHQKFRSGGMKVLTFRKRDREAGERKRPEKADALRKVLKGARRLYLR